MERIVVVYYIKLGLLFFLFISLVLPLPADPYVGTYIVIRRYITYIVVWLGETKAFRDKNQELKQWPTKVFSYSSLIQHEAVNTYLDCQPEL